MTRAILIIGAGISVSLTLGALIGLWRCYLQRQLNAWRKQRAEQYAKRKAGTMTREDKPAPPGGDQAA